MNGNVQHGSASQFSVPGLNSGSEDKEEGREEERNENYGQVGRPEIINEKRGR